MAADGERASIMRDARSFSILMNSAALVYNLLLAEAYEGANFNRVPNPVDDYRGRLEEWAATPPTLADDLAGWDRETFWARVHLQNPNISHRTRRFIDRWIELLAPPIFTTSETTTTPENSSGGAKPNTNAGRRG